MSPIAWVRMRMTFTLARGTLGAFDRELRAACERFELDVQAEPAQLGAATLEASYNFEGSDEAIGNLSRWLDEQGHGAPPD